MKLRPEIKAQWLDALPRFKQTDSVLRNMGNVAREVGGYCCLGVLCALAPPSVGHWQGGRFTNPDETETSDTELIPDVLAWAFEVVDGHHDLRCTVPIAGVRARRYSRDDHETVFNPDQVAAHDCTLAEMNDAGMTFAQIADVIRWAL